MFDIIRTARNSRDFIIVKSYMNSEGLVKIHCGALRVMGEKYISSYVLFRVADNDFFSTKGIFSTLEQKAKMSVWN